jgi:hypothetical protein
VILFSMLLCWWLDPDPGSSMLRVSSFGDKTALSGGVLLAEVYNTWVFYGV